MSVPILFNLSNLVQTLLITDTLNVSAIKSVKLNYLSVNTLPKTENRIFYSQNEGF
jgi:hypothetical protein